MQYGIVFPHHEIGSDPGAIKAFVQGAEALGATHLLIYDHVLGADPNRPGGWKNRPYDKDVRFHEPFTTLAFVAAVTERLNLMSAVLILPQRQTVLAARQAAEVDLLSGGRLRLGVGIGWNRVEMEGMGEKFTNRGKRVEEQVEVMRALWTQDVVQFSGKYHQLDHVGINPPPVQRPIPVWFGGYTDVVFRRAARLGDGMLPSGRLDDAPQRMAAIKGYLAEYGRSLDDFGIDVWLQASNYPEPEWAHFVRTWANLGATHMGLNTMRMGFTTLDQHLAMLKKFIVFKQDTA
jgi:probable F420-dependent oxidoreductase